MATGIGQYGFGVKQLRYAEAGKYFTATNPTPGTGIITGVVTSLADTTPYIVFKNNNPVGSKVNCYLDKLVLDCTVVGTTFSGSRKFAHKLDASQTTARYTSGGSTWGSGLTSPINNVNADSQNQSGVQLYVGAITAAAAGSARLIESGTLCSAIEVVFSTFVFDFGAPLVQPITGLIDNSTTVMHKYFPTAPVIVGPQEHYLFHVWGATLSVGITFGFNLGWIEA
jgi:hypothetical protein